MRLTLVTHVPPSGYDLMVPDQPRTLAELIAELRRVAKLPPVERARVIPGLIDTSKSVLSRERGAAMDEATKAGMPTVALAAELGVHRSKVADALSRYRGEKTA